jgi:DNA-binding transcriptional regulator YdaS (Cro superfamily)
MLLIDWIKKNNMNIPQFAKKMGVNASGIYKYIHGAKRLSPDMAVRIEDFTKGEVTRFEALWPELYDKNWIYQKDYYGR